MVSRSGVRRSAIAGVAVGAAFALVAGLRDRLAATHDANPFAPHNDPHAAGRLAHNTWERRAFAAEHTTISTHLPVPRDDVLVVHASDRRADPILASDAAVSEASSSSLDLDLDAATPLDLTYPDPFKVFTGCEPQSIAPRLAPRALDLVADPSDPEWPVNCEGHETLCDVLRAVAINREVLAAVANSQAPGIFEFVDGIVRLGVKNFVVIALDDALDAKLRARGVASYRVRNDAKGSHKISAQKFGIIQEFVERGCSVLLTDTDVAWLQNPFPYLYRDSDIESMSDGWDASSAHGFLETVDDPSAGADGRKRARAFRVAALNSGMWLVMATHASRRLMAIMSHRMATEDLWDQSGYNLELWLASRDAHATAGATVRVMDPLCFVNSKVMFRFIRHAPALRKEKHVPVAMHANYHTDKAYKMQRAYEYYAPGGTVAALGKRCEVGCDANLKSVAELERAHAHSVNDGIVGSKKWVEGAEGVWPEGGHGAADPGHCAPAKPWKGAVTSAPMTRELHLLPAANLARVDADAAAAAADADATADPVVAATRAALASVDPDAPEVILVTLLGGTRETEAATEAATARVFFASGVARLSLQSRVLVVAGDDAAARLARAAGVRAVAAIPDWRGSRTALKWRAIHATLLAGRRVLALDPNVALLSDPSPHFSRDVDVEAASDGWDDVTAYGYDHVVDDPAMEWSRFCHGARVLTVDPGFAAMAPTREAARLAAMVAARAAAGDSRDEETRVTSEKSASKSASDADFEHLVFNEALHLPSHGSYASPGATRRTLNYLCFANTKALFRFARKDARWREPAEHVPVAVRASYHPNEPERLEDIYAYYVERKPAALRAWSDGTGRGEDGGSSDSRAACDAAGAKATTKEEDAHPLGRLFRTRRKWSWGGVTPFSFRPGGELHTPWGDGSWGFVPATATGGGGKAKANAKGNDPNRVFAKFAGATHVLSFETAGEGDAAVPLGMFVSERCSDGDMVIGRAVEGDDDER